MNLKQFANVDSFCRDLDTGMEISWHDYMGRVIMKLGIENIKPYIPYGLDFLKTKFKEDKHFNNTKLVSWMSSAGFRKVINNKTKAEDIFSLHCGLSILFMENGITCFSPSDCVSVLKETARRLCET